MTTKESLICPVCGHQIQRYKNPIPSVDIIIELNNDIVLIERKNPPPGWAIPGGFIDYGESAEQTAVREAKEETCLDVAIVHLLGVYSQPNRDPRFHTISIVFVAQGKGIPQAADDAQRIGLFRKETLPATLAFDHARILSDYYGWKASKEGSE